MRQYKILGGQRLSGEIAIGGAKNAVLPIIAAACLNQSEVYIHNCPRISDVLDSVEILECIGCSVEFLGNTLKISSSAGLKYDVPDECATKMRSSILFLGALLSREKRANLALPGGCSIGERAIDLHLHGLELMGAKITRTEEKLFCETEGLRGAKINLAFASVGATENLMIAAVKARGETIIENAAREPEIVDLARFLKTLGANIRGAGTKTIVIKGVDRLNSHASHETMPDRIVAGTYLLAAAMTGGEITLANVRPFDLAPFASYLTEMGCKLYPDDNCVSLAAPKRLLAVPRITTKVHPGFPTDMQAQFVAALSIADGQSEVTETIFEERYKHVQELRKMGADIRLTADKKTFITKGVERLHGATVTAHDLRCGAALVLAGLAAEGETLVKDAQYVERGYASLESDLRSLGTEICLVGAGGEAVFGGGALVGGASPLFSDCSLVGMSPRSLDSFRV
ncbi:MAG: UDP-N-acetylglucosamine 1-carboxyvinyltransferase [Defluviitaleaceae bacterium]|nr:UDP-N-acetylglucosamine 1-carboxyvinyltransferase [Defluviitaleaceae bacterium]